MTFERIIGHLRQKDILRRALHSGRVAHAYLFEGPEGVGKHLMAVALARALFCAERNGCGDCIPCRKVDHNNHPDLTLIEPDGQNIKIEQIRELQRTLALRPVEAPRRVCLIDQAERMNAAAANALLKTLEEPVGDTVIVLISARPDALLTTVKSRCQRLPFSRIAQEKIEAALRNQRQLDPQQAHVLAALSCGSFRQAFDRDPNVGIDQRRELLTSVTALTSGSVLPTLALAETLAGEKEHLPERLEILLSFYRDLLLHHFGLPDTALVNIDLLEKIHRVAAREDSLSLLRKLEAIGASRRNLDRNVNAQLNMEVLLLRLAA